MPELDETGQPVKRGKPLETSGKYVFKRGLAPERKPPATEIYSERTKQRAKLNAEIEELQAEKRKRRTALQSEIAELQAEKERRHPTPKIPEQVQAQPSPVVKQPSGFGGIFSGGLVGRGAGDMHITSPAIVARNKAKAEATQKAFVSSQSGQAPIDQSQEPKRNLLDNAGHLLNLPKGALSKLIFEVEKKTSPVKYKGDQKEIDRVSKLNVFQQISHFADQPTTGLARPYEQAEEDFRIRNSSAHSQVTEAGAQFIYDLAANPLSWITGGVGAAGKAALGAKNAARAGRVISGAFAIQQAAQAMPELKRGVEEKNPHMFTKGLLGLGMSTLAAKHAALGSKTLLPPETTKETPAALSAKKQLALPAGKETPVTAKRSPARSPEGAIYQEPPPAKAIEAKKPLVTPARHPKAISSPPDPTHEQLTLQKANRAAGEPRKGLRAIEAKKPIPLPPVGEELPARKAPPEKKLQKFTPLVAKPVEKAYTSPVTDTRGGNDMEAKQLALDITAPEKKAPAKVEAKPQAAEKPVVHPKYAIEAVKGRFNDGNIDIVKGDNGVKRSLFHEQPPASTARQLVKAGYAEEVDTGSKDYRDDPIKTYKPTQKMIDLHEQLQTLKKGVPISERPSGMGAEKIQGQMQIEYSSRETGHKQIAKYRYAVNQVNGETWHSNGHYAAVGDAPAGHETYAPPIDRVVPKEESLVSKPIKATHFSVDAPSDSPSGKAPRIHFDNGADVNPSYYDYFLKRWPDAEFYPQKEVEGRSNPLLKPITVKSKGKTVGVMMPMEPVKIAGRTEAMKAASKLAEHKGLLDVAKRHQLAGTDITNLGDMFTEAKKADPSLTHEAFAQQLHDLHKHLLSQGKDAPFVMESPTSGAKDANIFTATREDGSTIKYSTIYERGKTPPSPPKGGGIGTGKPPKGTKAGAVSLPDPHEIKANVEKAWQQFDMLKRKTRDKLVKGGSWIEKNIPAADYHARRMASARGWARQYIDNEWHNVEDPIKDPADRKRLGAYLNMERAYNDLLGQQKIESDATADIANVKALKPTDVKGRAAKLKELNRLRGVIRETKARQAENIYNRNNDAANTSTKPKVLDPVDNKTVITHDVLEKYLTRPDVQAAADAYEKHFGSLMRENYEASGRTAAGDVGHFTKVFTPSAPIEEFGSPQGSGSGASGGLNSPIYELGQTPGAGEYTGTAGRYNPDLKAVTEDRIAAGLKSKHSYELIKTLGSNRFQEEITNQPKPQSDRVTKTEDVIDPKTGLPTGAKKYTENFGHFQRKTKSTPVLDSSGNPTSRFKREYIFADKTSKGVFKPVLDDNGKPAPYYEKKDAAGNPLWEKKGEGVEVRTRDYGGYVETTTRTTDLGTTAGKRYETSYEIRKKDGTLVKAGSPVSLQEKMQYTGIGKKIASLPAKVIWQEGVEPELKPLFEKEGSSDFRDTVQKINSNVISTQLAGFGDALRHFFTTGSRAGQVLPAKRFGGAKPGLLSKSANVAQTTLLSTPNSIIHDLWNGAAGSLRFSDADRSAAMLHAQEANAAPDKAAIRIRTSGDANLDYAKSTLRNPVKTAAKVGGKLLYGEKGVLSNHMTSIYKSFKDSGFLDTGTTKEREDATRQMHEIMQYVGNAHTAYKSPSIARGGNWRAAFATFGQTGYNNRMGIFKGGGYHFLGRLTGNAVIAAMVFKARDKEHRWPFQKAGIRLGDVPIGQEPGGGRTGYINYMQLLNSVGDYGDQPINDLFLSMGRHESPMTTTKRIVAGVVNEAAAPIFSGGGMRAASDFVGLGPHLTFGTHNELKLVEPQAKSFKNPKKYLNMAEDMMPMIKILDEEGKEVGGHHIQDLKLKWINNILAPVGVPVKFPKNNIRTQANKARHAEKALEKKDLRHHAPMPATP
jgi:hypothetical protein